MSEWQAEFTSDGIRGPQGPIGPQGLQGEKGDKGEKGDNGDVGFSPIAQVSKSGAVATITITDANGTTTAQVSDGIGNITDVKVDGASVVNNSVANIDLTTKVDKVAGKGLSTNDFTNIDKVAIETMQIQITNIADEIGDIETLLNAI